MKIVSVIPAHLASVRFPRKILYPFYKLPMIEHVRRRALLVKAISDVYVATCDEEIAESVRSYGGQVIMTSNRHTNGMTRVAEAIQQINCTHVILLQGDEPLLIPRHLELMIGAIQENPDGDAWNATGPIEEPEELDRHSFVKCSISKSNRILYCFRKSPGYAEFCLQQEYIRKILGLIVYRKDFLLNLADLQTSIIEKTEFIEQMRIIENGFYLQSVPVYPSLPSVNEPQEANLVLDYIENNAEQQELLKQTLGIMQNC
jgi:3-deoxy-manno-octulosonate cytidylyltransferase (CMP-KDO synthetase)